MVDTARDDAREHFTEKNAARRAGRDRVGRRAYNEARELRLSLGTGGAFGRFSAALVMQCAVGTQGERAVA